MKEDEFIQTLNNSLLADLAKLQMANMELERKQRKHGSQNNKPVRRNVEEINLSEAFSAMPKKSLRKQNCFNKIDVNTTDPDKEHEANNARRAGAGAGGSQLSKCLPLLLKDSQQFNETMQKFSLGKPKHSQADDCVMSILSTVPKILEKKTLSNEKQPSEACSKFGLISSDIDRQELHYTASKHLKSIIDDSLDEQLDKYTRSIQMNAMSGMPCGKRSHHKTSKSFMYPESVLKAMRDESGKSDTTVPFDESSSMKRSESSPNCFESLKTDCPTEEELEKLLNRHCLEYKTLKAKIERSRAKVAKQETLLRIKSVFNAGKEHLKAKQVCEKVRAAQKAQQKSFLENSEKVLPSKNNASEIKPSTKQTESTSNAKAQQPVSKKVSTNSCVQCSKKPQKKPVDYVSKNKEKTAAPTKSESKLDKTELKPKVSKELKDAIKAVYSTLNKGTETYQNVKAVVDSIKESTQLNSKMNKVQTPDLSREESEELLSVINLFKSESSKTSHKPSKSQMSLGEPKSESPADAKSKRMPNNEPAQPVVINLKDLNSKIFCSYDNKEIQINVNEYLQLKAIRPALDKILRICLQNIEETVKVMIDVGMISQMSGLQTSDDN